MEAKATTSPEAVAEEAPPQPPSSPPDESAPEGASPLKPSAHSPTLPSYPTLHPEALASLVDAVREPLIVCLGRVKNGHSSISPGRVLTANPMACALLNRDLESVQSMPLASLVATASGRPPPPGLVSKCKLHCADSESVSVECDCRVLADAAEKGESVPLIFCHLAILDVREPPERPAGSASGSEGVGARSAVAVADDAEANEADIFTWPRAKALAEVQLERLKILVVEDDLFSAAAVRELCQQCDFEVEVVGGGAE